MGVVLPHSNGLFRPLAVQIVDVSHRGLPVAVGAVGPAEGPPAGPCEAPLPPVVVGGGVAATVVGDGVSVIGGQQVLPIGIAVGVGVALAAVGGRQQIARPVVGEGICGVAVGGPRQLTQRIVGVAPCPAAGGLLRDVPGGVVGEAAADLLLAPEGAAVLGDLRGGAACPVCISVGPAGLAADSRQAAQRIIGEAETISHSGGHGGQQAVGDGVFRRVVGVLLGIGGAVQHPRLSRGLTVGVVALGGMQHLRPVLRHRAVRQPVQPVIDVADRAPVAVRYGAEMAVRVIGVGTGAALRIRLLCDPVPAIVAVAHPGPIAVGLPGQISVPGGVGIPRQRPVSHLQSRQVAEGIIGKGVDLFTLPGGAVQGRQLAFAVSIPHPRLFCNLRFRQAAQRIVAAAADGPQRIGGGGGQPQHLADAAAVPIAHGGAAAVRDGGEAGASGVIGGAAGHGQAAAGEGGPDDVALPGVGHGLRHRAARHGGAVVLAVILIAVCPVSAGDGLDEVPLVVGVGLRLQTRGGHGHQIAVLVILHGLGRLPDQGDVIEVGGVGVLLIGQQHLDGGDLQPALPTLPGYQRHADKLPCAQVRAEGDIVPLVGAVRIVDAHPQAELLELVQLLAGSLGLGICYGVRPGPAGEHIGIRCRGVDGDALIGVAVLILPAALDPDGTTAAVPADTGDDAGPLTHAPAGGAGDGAVFQQFRAALAHGGRPLGAVVLLIRAAAAGIDGVGGPQQLAGGVGGIGVHRPACVVEKIAGQQVVPGVGGAVRAVVPIHRLTDIGIADAHPDAAAVPGRLRVGADSSAGIGEAQAVIRLRIRQLRQPLAGVGIPCQRRAVSVDGGELSVRVGQRHRAAGGVPDGGEPVVGIGQRRHGDAVGAAVLLGHGGELAAGVGHRDAVAVGVRDGFQIASAEEILVVLVVGHLIAAADGPDLQPQTVLVVIVGGVPAAVLAEVMLRSVSVGITQVCRPADGLGGQLLHAVQRPAGAEAHAAAVGQIRRRPAQEIVGVIHQTDREGVHRGGVGCRLLHHLHLPSGVRQPDASGMACSNGVIGIVRLDAGGIAVCHGEYGGVGLAVSDALGQGAVGVAVRPTVRRQHGHRPVLRPLCVPLLHGSGHIPADVAALRIGGNQRIVQHMAGIHGGLVVPRHVVQPVVVVVVRIRVGPRHLAHLQRQLRASHAGVAPIAVALHPDEEVQRSTGDYAALRHGGQCPEVEEAPLLPAGDAVAQIQVLIVTVGSIGLLLRHIGGVDGSAAAHLRPPGLGDEGGVNGHGKGCPVHPRLVRLYRQHRSLRRLLQQVFCGVGGVALSIHHIRRRDAVDGGTLSIVQQHAAVLLQMGRQTIQCQQKIVAIALLLLPQDDLLLQVIAVGRIAQIHAGIHLPVEHAGRQRRRHQVLRTPALSGGQAHDRRLRLHLRCDAAVIVRLPCRQGLHLRRVQQPHGDRHVPAGRRCQLPMGQVLGEGRRYAAVVPRVIAPGVRGQGIVDVPPLALFILIMHRRAVGDRQIAAVREAEVLSLLRAQLLHLALQRCRRRRLLQLRKQNTTAAVCALCGRKRWQWC